MLVLQIVDPSYDLPVSDFEDGTGQTLGKVVDELFLVVARGFADLVVLKVALDLAVQRRGHVHPLFKALQRLQLLVQFLSRDIHAGDHACDVADGVGVENDGADDPADTKDALGQAFAVDVAEAYSQESLGGPIERHAVPKANVARIVVVIRSIEVLFMFKVGNPRVVLPSDPTVIREVK